MNKETLQKILDLIEFYYGDCSCDDHVRCKFCKITDDLIDLK